MILLPLALAAEPDPPAWVPAGAEVVVTLGEGAPRVALEYRFRQVRPGWAELPLAGPALTPLPGAEADGAALARGPGGLYAVLLPDRSVATVRVEGLLPESRGAAELALLPTAGGRVRVDAPGLAVRSSAVGGVLPSSGKLTLSWAPEVARAPTVAAPVVLGESAVAAWESEGALAVRARVRWKVVRGERAAFRLDVAGLDEVEVTGANVARWERRGDVVDVTPREPVRGLWTVEVTGRRALPSDAEVAVPRVGPADALRVERFVTLGRAEERDVVPRTAARALPPRALPAWARGLSDTPAVAAWSGDAPVTVRAMRFEPLMGPDTVVERADFVLSTSAEGRVLLRSTWLVRNERRQYLHVRPVAGFRPLTARVSGTPLSVLSDGAGGLLVPLEKSVETMLGLVSFPVEVTWIADGEGWATRGERAFALPSVDAPIQATRWELHLPRGVEVDGPRGRVSGGVEGGVVGGVVGGVLNGAAASEAPDDLAAAAGQAAWLNALDAYKDNDFETTQRWLDVAREQAPSDENVSRLQSNLDVLMGGEDQDDGQARRVRELANAKTVTQQVEQAEVEKKAEEALRSGDAEAAEAYLEQAVELAERIAVTEQRESQEYAVKMKSSADKLASLRKQAKEQDEEDVRTTAASSGVLGSLGSSAAQPAPEPPPEAVGMDDRRGGVADGLGSIGASGYGRGGGGMAEGIGGFGTVGTGEGGGGSPEGAPAEAPMVVEPESVVASTPTSDTAAVLTPELLERIPTGRTYQDTVSVVAGVSGRKGRSGKADAGGTLGAATVTTTVSASGAARPAPASRDATNPDAGVGARAAPAQVAPVEVAAENLPAAEDLAAPPARAALRVEASPLTPALPLDGAVVTHAEALLPAGANPELTFRYRTRGPR